MTRNRLILIIVGLIVIGLVVYAFLVANSGRTSSANGYPERADGIAFIDAAVTYDDLGRMTATTDLVVQGTVLTVERGLTHRYLASQGLADETDRLLTVQVGEVIYASGGAVEPGDTISIIEGWWSEGVGYEVEGMTWAKPGDQGYFYLLDDTAYPVGTYTYVSMHGRVLMTGEGVAVSGDRQHSDGPWDDMIAGKQVERPFAVETRDLGSAAAVRGAILSAADSARRGNSKPMPRPQVSRPGE